jgi:UDP-glucuronate decarboxylase
MQRVLVAGGAGLVGSHLVDRLLADGDEVIAVDDLSRGSFANVAHLKHEPRFAFIEHDLTAPFRANVTQVFHLAIPSTRVGCALDPVKAAMTCVAGTVNALETAAANGARLVLVTSTDRFGDGVRCAESVAIDFAKKHHVEVRIVRMPMPYGPRMPPDAAQVVSSLCVQGLCRDSLVPPAGLDEIMRLTYVDDAVDTVVRMMRSDLHMPPVLAPFQQATVGHVASLVAEAAGRGQSVLAPDAAVSAGPESMPQSMPIWGRPTLADAIPATIAFGIGAATDLSVGLAATFEWFACRMGARPENRTSGVYVRDSRASSADKQAARS